MKLDDSTIPFCLCIREWDAAMAGFRVPDGSKLRPCHLCRASVWVQKSMLKAIEKRKHYIICFVCMDKLPKPKDGAEVFIVPEAVPELNHRMTKQRLAQLYGKNFKLKIWGAN